MHNTSNISRVVFKSQRSTQVRSINASSSYINESKDPDTVALPYANYDAKSGVFVVENANEASYRNDKELLEDIALLANAMVPLHTLKEMRNHMQPRARAKWDRYLEKAASLTTKIEVEYANALGPNPNAIPDLTAMEATDLTKDIDYTARAIKEKGRAMGKDIILPESELFDNDDVVDHQPVMNDNTEEAADEYDEESYDEPPLYAVLLEKFLSVAVEKRTTNNLEGEIEMERLREFDEKMAQKSEEIDEEDNSVEEAIYDHDEYDGEYGYDEEGIERNENEDEDGDSKTFVDFTKSGNEDVDRFQKRVNYEEDYDAERERERERNTEEDEEEEDSEMEFLQKPLPEFDASTRERVSFEKDKFTDRRPPIGTNWSVKHYNEEDDNVKMLPWYELDAVLIEFEDEFLPPVVDLMVERQDIFASKDPDADLAKELQDRAEEPERAVKDIVTSGIESELVKSARFAEIEAKFLQISPNVKPISPETLLSTLTISDPNDSEEQVQRQIDARNASFASLRQQMRRRIEFDGVDAYLPYLYLIDFWRESSEEHPTQMALLLKTMTDAEKEIFMKNQNQLLQKQVQDLYTVRPDIYEYFTTRLSIPAPTLLDPPHLTDYIKSMEAENPIVRPLISYKDTMKRILTEYPDFLPSTQEAIVADDIALSNAALLEAENFFAQKQQQTKDGKSKTTTTTTTSTTTVGENVEITNEQKETTYKKLEALADEIRDSEQFSPLLTEEQTNKILNEETEKPTKKKIKRRVKFDINSPENLEKNGIIISDEDQPPQEAGHYEYDYDYDYDGDLHFGDDDYEYDEDEGGYENAYENAYDNAYENENNYDYDDELRDSAENKTIRRIEQAELDAASEPVLEDQENPLEHMLPRHIQKQRIAVISFKLKQMYLSEIENSPENDEDRNETAPNATFHRIHSTRIIDIPPKWLQLLKSVEWPDASEHLMNYVHHMPSEMAFEERLGDNDRQRLLMLEQSRREQE